MLKRFSILLLVTILFGGLMPTEAVAQATINRKIIQQTKNVKPKPAPKQKQAPTQKAVSESLTGSINSHEWVDMGLPSGLRWATCNVGAYSPTSGGDFFAWGETNTKSSYKESNSQTYGKDNSWLRSNGYLDSRGNLTMSHDAARQNWGGNWRMPTREEIEELIANTTTTWTTQGGVYGRLVTSNNNGKTLFFPATGYRFADSLLSPNEYGLYWGSAPESSLYCSSGIFLITGDQRRYLGEYVRAVSENPTRNAAPAPAPKPATKSLTGSINGHEWVDMGLPSGLKWATCNVGAYSPTGSGEYFAWGETYTKSSYNESNSQTYGKDNSWLRSNGYLDSRGNLTMSHDAARQNWGGTWRMPTKKEIEELIANTTITWTTQGGVYGRLVTSKINGKTLFFPATGYRFATYLQLPDEYGLYWSSTSYETDKCNTYSIYCSKSLFSTVSEDRRYLGLFVRAVSE